MHKSRSTPYAALITALSLLFASCGKGEAAPPDVVSVDLDNSVAVAVDSTRVVPLETTDSSMIYDICTLERVGDTLVVHSRSYLRCFDAASGRYLGDVAHAGHKPGQFDMIGNLWMEGDTVALFDVNSSTILRYTPSGRFLGAEMPFKSKEFPPGESPRTYYKVSDGVITINSSSGGSTAYNPAMTFYDAKTGKSRALAGRQLREGGFMIDGFIATPEGYLYWEPMRDTIFTADPQQGVTPRYVIDFGKDAFPKELQGKAALPHRVEAFMGGKDKHRWASLVRYVQPYGSDLLFTATTNNDVSYLVRAPRQGGKARAYHLATPDGRLTQTTFFKIMGDSAMVEMRNRTDIEANPYLVTIALSDLK